MTDAIYLIVGLLCGLPMGWALRNPAPELNKLLIRRVDSTLASMLRESDERGKLARRRVDKVEAKLHQMTKPAQRSPQGTEE